jgi:hypothetical protein
MIIFFFIMLRIKKAKLLFKLKIMMSKNLKQRKNGEFNFDIKRNEVLILFVI